MVLSKFNHDSNLLDSAGFYTHFPHARGLYKENSVEVIVNNQDHLMVTVEDDRLDTAFENLVHTLAKIEDKCQYQHSEKYGYLTTNLVDLGTTMYASITISLPKLGREL